MINVYILVTSSRKIDYKSFSKTFKNVNTSGILYAIKTENVFHYLSVTFQQAVQNATFTKHPFLSHCITALERRNFHDSLSTTQITLSVLTNYGPAASSPFHTFRAVFYALLHGVLSRNLHRFWKETQAHVTKVNTKEKSGHTCIDRWRGGISRRTWMCINAIYWMCCILQQKSDC